jgi:SNF2 family DNA or RNA helicase
MATPFDANFIATLTPAKAREWSLKMAETLSEINQRSETDISQFRDELKAMDDASLFHNNQGAKCITEKIIQIRKDTADEKIIVAAHTDELLDIVAEMLEREFRKNEAIRRSVGRIDKMTFKHSTHGHEQRYSLVQRLNDSSDDLGIVLLSALDSGWWGPSMHGASTMLLCDAVWSQAVYERLVGTIRRFSQTRPCTIWDYGRLMGFYEAAKAVREKSQIY